MKLEQHSIVCYNLSKTYDNGKEALKNLNLKIKKGEVYGLLGPNGAGKTTMISIITGFLEKTSGGIFVNSLNMDEHKLPKKLALCPQFNIQWPNLTVREHLIIFGLLRNIKWKDVHKLVEENIKKVDLEDKKDIEASKLSGGMRRRLSIAIALMGNTEIIFLDEPTTGLDPKRRRELWEIIKSIREQKTFIISTHLMEEAEFLCDRIGIMTLGQLRAVGTANYLKEQFVNYFQVELTLKEEFEFWTEELKGKLIDTVGGRIRYEFGKLIKVQIENEGNQSYLGIFKSVGKCKDFVKSWSLKSGSLEDAFAVIEGRFK
jgi:ABC-type multidrug transport system ATPase subunit